MDPNLLIAQGNQHREDREYARALACYAQTFVQDPGSAAAFNNYGNVLREMGDPSGAVCFLQRALTLNPNDTVAIFNLAVCYLLMGDYCRGWSLYESRWNYEHLAGTLPNPAAERWQGQDLRDRDILIIGEQGHGDCIQFSRFLWNLHVMGARIHLQVTDGLVPMFVDSPILASVSTHTGSYASCDYWSPLMSLPGVLGITLENLPRPINYITARSELMAQWRQRLGPKTRTRVGLCWSGRRDSWLNRHKSMPFDQVLGLIQSCPNLEWINLQVDATAQEISALEQQNIKMFPGTITGFHDTAALISQLDVVVTVDTAVAHLSGALGCPTWIMLQKYAVDWRWLLDRADSPWYSTARLFRQKDFDDWSNVLDQIQRFLGCIKV